MYESYLGNKMKLIKGCLNSEYVMNESYNNERYDELYRKYPKSAADIFQTGLTGNCVWLSGSIILQNFVFSNVVLHESSEF